MAEHFAGIPGMFLALPFTLFITNQILFDNNNNNKKEKERLKKAVLITD
jgi:predicted PurR-regulated permease PerM